MKFRRALWVVDGTKDPGPTLAVLKRVAPQLEHLLIHGSGELDAVREAAAGVATTVSVQVAPELNGEALAALCVAEEIDVLVFGERSLKSAWLVTLRRKPLPIPVLWAAGAGTEPIEEVGCVALDEAARATIDAFVRTHGDASLRISMLSLPGASEESKTGSLRQWFAEWKKDRRVDLLVVTTVPAALALGARWSAPMLLLPSAPESRRAIDVPDVVDDGGPLRVRIDQPAVVGDLSPLADQAWRFVAGGRVVAETTTRGGEATLPAGLGAQTIGVASATGDPSVIAQWIAVVRPTAQPVILFDAELPSATLREMARGLEGSAFVAVRLRPSRSCRSIRGRLTALALPPQVVDARAVLDEGEALDVSPPLDPVRLARVASKLKAAGFPIRAIVHAGPARPMAAGFAVLSGPNLEPDAEGDAPIDATSITGNRVDFELDNATARQWLLEAIETSTVRLHLQVYMALDDEVGKQVETALSDAAARGVTVRVLVDSLHGFHGSFGIRNPLFQRLSERPNIEVRTLRPITELPSIADLKQRDHRKLVVADGTRALLGGRNLSHEYYTGFDEVALTAQSDWREVPWLDAGARIEGPAVAAVDAAFLEAWTGAGGAAFERVAVPPAGPSAARVVVHRGLRDARTLEAYLALIDGAKSDLRVVNGFPLALELQHALLRALGRGVRVRTLIGHMTPTHDGERFTGMWAAARTLATELAHSRMDPIVAEGGQVHVFARKALKGWAPGLGVVQPHVHAKLISADGLRGAVGSANLDITASYWESELMLVVEDPVQVAALDAQIDALLVESTLVQREDPLWQQAARKRAWMRHWPGLLSA